MLTEIKICGITRLEDARSAARAGADPRQGALDVSLVEAPGQDQGMPAGDPGSEVPVGFLSRSTPAPFIGGIEKECHDGIIPQGKGDIFGTA